MFKKTLVIQYSGDFLEAYKNMQAEGPEYYAYQRYSLKAVESVASQVDEVATLCCFCEAPYNVEIKPGLRSIGLGLKDNLNTKLLFQKLTEFIKEYQPDLIVFRTPLQQVIAWANKNEIPVCTLLADSFSYNKVLDRYRHYVLARTLNHKNVMWVSNHALNASRSLVQIGVKPEKVVPWDWPEPNTNEEWGSKAFPQKETYTLMYVGEISEAKGVLDCINAVKKFNETYSKKLILDIYGKDEGATFEALIKSLNVEQHVNLKGRVPNNEVLNAMRNADIILVPSRREYPEGVPKTIGEALRSKTPIIASDHPMFSSKIQTRVNSLIFPSADVEALVSSINELISNPDLYEQLSQSMNSNINTFKFIEWGKMLEAFVIASPEMASLLESKRIDKMEQQS